MHVLRRPHQLHRAALAALAAAVLAIVLTLAIASSLNDLSTSPTAAGAPAPHAAVHASAIRSQTSNPIGPRTSNPIGPRTSNPLALNPFPSSSLAGPLIAPPHPPWAPAAS